MMIMIGKCENLLGKVSAREIAMVSNELQGSLRLVVVKVWVIFMKICANG